MSDDVKRKIAYTWRGLFLITAGILGVLIGLGITSELEDAGKYGHLMVTIISIVSFLLGLNTLYIAYVLPKKKKKQQLKETEMRIASNSYNNNSKKNFHTENKTNIPKEQLEILKELYDSGVITEAEFEKKKKQLLGL